MEMGMEEKSFDMKSTYVFIKELSPIHNHISVNLSRMATTKIKI